MSTISSRCSATRLLSARRREVQCWSDPTGPLRGPCTHCICLYARSPVSRCGSLSPRRSCQCDSKRVGRCLSHPPPPVPFSSVALTRGWCPSSLVMQTNDSAQAVVPTHVFGCVSGAIGVIAPLNRVCHVHLWCHLAPYCADHCLLLQAQYELLSKVQSALQEAVKPVGGFGYGRLMQCLIHGGN